jgi:hypothetical protein
VIRLLAAAVLNPVVPNFLLLITGWSKKGHKETKPVTANMKSLKYLAAVVALATALTLPATASLVTDIGGVPFKSAGNPDGNNNPESNFDALSLFLAGHPGSSVGTPIFLGDATPNFTGLETIDLLGYCYAVVHYGAGPNGTEGGSLEFFSIMEDANPSTYLFPQIGAGNGGLGGISSVRLFPCVPDGGTTVALLGMAMAGLGTVRRFLKR